MIDAKPGLRSFFKYAAPDTAIAVLRNKTVRYSSPLRFNDPFDIQSGLHFDFNLHHLHEKVLAQIEQLAAAPSAPAVDKDDPWGKLVLLCREHYPKHGFPRSRWQEETAPLFDQLLEIIQDTQAKCQQHWNALLPGMRVFCVFEERDNLLMWAHYAKDHTGVVFEFLPLPEKDNALSVARKVKYAASSPPFFTEPEWLDDLLSIKRLDIQAMNQRYMHHKGQQWSYEKEWRVWYPTYPAPSVDYTDTPIHKAEFPAMYIGCNASDSFAMQVVDLARASFPGLRIYRACRRTDAYELEYTEV